MSRIIILDTETAGLKPPANGGSGVCDIALMVVNEDFDVLWQTESLIDPGCAISPEAMGVHHITEEMVWDKPTLLEFMEMHEMPLYDADVVIGHHVEFDCRFLMDYLPEDFKSLDTLKLARNAWPDAESHKLQTLRYTFKLDAGDAHRAMGDVITTLNLAKHLMAWYGTDFNGLMSLMSAPLSLDTKIHFGKHRGERLRDLPKNYVDWLLNKADIDPDLRAALAVR